ncbi:hypothetical protein C8R45DRAFT_1213224 [Mycena sanguinolenta]|nr:hypothetical protein C8R45DRAFT_1213224 [Mycena sanguinolenta]
MRMGGKGGCDFFGLGRIGGMDGRSGAWGVGLDGTLASGLLSFCEDGEAVTTRAGFNVHDTMRERLTLVLRGRGADDAVGEVAPGDVRPLREHQGRVHRLPARAVHLALVRNRPDAQVFRLRRSSPLHSTATSTSSGRARPHPTGPAPSKFTSFHPLHTSEPPVKGLLAVHARRGDYEGHCVFLADWSPAYNAWSGLGNPTIGTYPSRPDFVSATPKDFEWPALPEHFSIPEGKTQQEAVMSHCWPSPEAIAARRDLRRMYISTNGDRTWVRDLAASDGWEEVKSSWDMELTLEEQAVDMGVLTAAEAFIGVGSGSLR